MYVCLDDIAKVVDIFKQEGTRTEKVMPKYIQAVHTRNGAKRYNVTKQGKQKTTFATLEEAEDHIGRE